MKHINNLLKAGLSPLDVGNDSALLSSCRYPECTAYKLEGGNHLN